jgi:hypothetical protein
MVMQARCLGQLDNMPVASYRTKKTPLLYITGTKVATLLHEAVKKILPSTLIDYLKKYSANFVHV